MASINDAYFAMTADPRIVACGAQQLLVIDILRSVDRYRLLDNKMKGVFRRVCVGVMSPANFLVNVC